VCFGFLVFARCFAPFPLCLVFFFHPVHVRIFNVRIYYEMHICLFISISVDFCVRVTVPGTGSGSCPSWSLGTSLPNLDKDSYSEFLSSTVQDERRKAQVAKNTEIRNSRPRTRACAGAGCV